MTTGPDRAPVDRLEKLRTSRQFKEVYERGKRFFDPFFQVFVLTREDSFLRFGITVTRKIGNAVVRNRTKRLIRESMRHLGTTLRPGHDIVILARHDIIGACEPEVRTSLARIFVKARLQARASHDT